jgi:hypothetical protein
LPPRVWRTAPYCCSLREADIKARIKSRRWALRFCRLAHKGGSARACLVAFDLLNLNGEDLRQHPIEERLAALSPLVAGVDSVLLSDALVAQGALVFARPASWAWRASVDGRVLFHRYAVRTSEARRVAGKYRCHRKCPDW